MTTKFFDPEHMMQVAKFYQGLSDLIDECDLNPSAVMSESDLYVLVNDITVRHSDDWTIGRFEIEDDFLHFNMDVPEQDGENPIIPLDIPTEYGPEIIKILRTGLANVDSISHDLRHAVSRFINDVEADQLLSES